jgi:rod shape-determining protein MreB
MPDNFFSSLTGRDMAVDLGTANTLIYVRGKGIVLNEPSVVAVNVRDGRPVAVGLEAKRMVGRTPSHIEAIRPMKDGVIADFEICEKMLSYFIRKAHNGVSRAWSSACRRHHRGRAAAVQEAAEYAARKPAYRRADGRRHRYGLPAGATGNMIVDIGGGTTEVAVISLGGTTSQSVRAGDEPTRASSTSSRRSTAWPSPRTAEEVKIALGSAWPLLEELNAEIRGCDSDDRPAQDHRATTDEVREAMEEPVSANVDAVKVTSTRRRPSWRPTSWTRASTWPVAGRCSTASTPVSTTRRACPWSWPPTRCTRWPWGPASRWRSSTR